MEVSLVVLVRLLFCVLVCGVHSTAADVVITHNENFDSGLVLKCSDKELFPLTSGVSVQRNGMDIAVDGGGTLRYLSMCLFQPVVQSPLYSTVTFDLGQLQRATALLGFNSILMA